MGLKTLIIDGTNLLYRVFYANTQHKSPTSHIYLFLSSLKSYVELFNPFEIIVCWDFRERDTENYRKMIDENYKAQRNKEQANIVYQYIPIIVKLLDTLGITQINPRNLEADDIIFWLATVKYPNQSVIISTDTDMYQLISKDLPGNIIYNPKKKCEINELYLRYYYNVNNGFEFIIRKALKGDKSDNLPGVKNIRSTKITDIISILSSNYDLDSLKDAGLLKEDELEHFKHNLKMMKFSVDMISSDELEWYENCLNSTKEANKEEFTILVKDLEFWNIYKKIDYWYKTLNRINYYKCIFNLD